jgi:hypothetical protein
MAWAKIDDSMPHHPKLVRAGPLAFALDVAAVCYSNRFGLNGRITDDLLAAVFPGFPDPQSIAGRLVEVGRWRRVDDGYVIHDIGDYQPSAERSADVSRKRSEAGRLGGRRSGEARSNEANVKQFASPVLEANVNPVPSRPVPSSSSSSSNGLQSERSYPQDDEERSRAVVQVIARARVARANPNNPAAYQRKVSRNVADELGQEIARLIHEYPDAPDDVIAAAAQGDKHSLRHYERKAM